MRRFLIGGTHSGCGKTTITCAVLQALKNRGLKLSSFKCGPDYIDPMFHKRVIGISAYNLDSYFCDDDTLNYLLYEESKSTDVSVIEGVMGFYDGVGERGSAHSVSMITDTPSVIVIDCRGMSESLGAVMKGFLEYRKPNNIKGFIFNKLPLTLEDKAKTLCSSLNTKYYGCFPSCEIKFDSRHLGLLTAEEIPDFEIKMNTLADLCEKHILLDELLKLDEEIPTYNPPEIKKYNSVKPLRIAVAKDSAFCFIYEENIELLKKMGCDVVFFSPLYDCELPENINGLILPGGYPELYAKQLSENKSIMNEIRAKINEGLPTIAECGGFMYLHNTLEDMNGDIFEMADVIHGKAFYTGKLNRFGYVKLCAEKNNMLCSKGEAFRAHEFHYYSSAESGADFTAVKANGKSWTTGNVTDTLYAGFPHMYFYSDTKIVGNFIKKCGEYGNEKNITD